MQVVDKDLRAVQDFLRNAGCNPKVQDAQFTYFKVRIRAMTLLATDAPVLMQTIAGGPWNMEQRDELVVAVSTSITTSMVAKAPDRRRANQEMMFFEHYPAMSELATIRDTTVHIMTKTQLVADRFLIGFQRFLDVLQLWFVIGFSTNC